MSPSDYPPNLTSSPIEQTHSVKSAPLSGIVRIAGDKSMSHRAIIFGALATGTTHIYGLLEGADILSTIGAMRALGATVEKQGDIWSVQGCGDGGLNTPSEPIDCGNAGTGVRLIMGAVSAYPLTATFTGDQSLRSRPMARILDPLRQMGVHAEASEGERLPITLTSNGALSPTSYTPPQASAQVKSAILLAGLKTEGDICIKEAKLTRDHTENMLRAFGVTLTQESWKAGHIIRLTGPVQLKGTTLHIPGDPSSAAFPIVAALMRPGSDVWIKNVMMNPTRTGLLETLVEMGADIHTANERLSGGELVADIRVRYSRLYGISVPESRAPSMIDEYPILAVAASLAEGRTHMPGIGELRVKESDRISATVSLLQKNGVSVSADENSMTVIGDEHIRGGGHVTTYHDHRIAMSALILGLSADHPVSIDDSSMIGTSFPGFFDLMTQLGADIYESTSS